MLTCASCECVFVAKLTRNACARRDPQTNFAVASASAQQSRCAIKFEEYRYDIATVDLISDLLALVTKDRIVKPFDGAHNYICQIAVQFDCGMLRAGQAAAAKDSDWHIEIAAKFLAKHVSSNFRSAKQGVETIVDRHSLVDSVAAAGVIKSGRRFD